MSTIITTSMPSSFWDKTLSTILTRIELGYPTWSEFERIIQALDELESMAYGPDALLSLAEWEKEVMQREVEERKVGGGKPPRGVRGFLRKVRREVGWRKVFNF